MSALLGYLIILGLSIVSRFPESGLLAIARAWGSIGPRVQPGRAALGRANLTRVYKYRDGAVPSAAQLDQAFNCSLNTTYVFILKQLERHGMRALSSQRGFR